MIRVILVICLLFITKILSAQEEASVFTETNFDEGNIRSLKFSATSTEELKTINWNDVRELFKNNEGNLPIALELEVNIPKTEKITKGVFRFKVNEDSRDVEEIIAKAKNGINDLNKRINNLKRYIDEN